MVQFVFSSNTKNIVKLCLIFAIFLTITIIHNPASEFVLCIFPGFLLCKETNLRVSEVSLTTSANKQKLDPNFITGFCDAESCFMINFEKSKSKIGWLVRARFKIDLHSKDLELLHSIRSFFNDVGQIGESSTRQSGYFQVSLLDDIVNVIIPHFEKYPLHSAKSIDFLLFKKCVELINAKEHLTQAGLEKIVSIKGAINRGLPDKLKLAFPYIKPLERPPYLVNEGALNGYWISGFVEGDGSFFVTIKNKGQILPTFSIGLNEREQPLLIKIQSFFGTGNIIKDSTHNAFSYRVYSIKHLDSIIIKHFEEFSLVGVKLPNYLIFKEIIFLMVKKSHLTPEGRMKIISLREKLNK